MQVIMFLGLIIGIILVWVLFFYGWHVIKGLKAWFKRRKGR